MNLKMSAIEGMLVSDICGNNCIFCSNHLNPPEVHTYKIGNRKIEDLIEEIDFIPSSSKYLSIGETGYNTTEGEILIYPHFEELILALKRKRPDLKLNICTSGSHITSEKIDFIKKHDISIVFSIHTINVKERMRLMNCSEERALNAINGLKECIKRKVDLESVRLVPTKDTLDEDIYNTLKFLITNDIPLIEIFAASYSKLRPGYTVESIKKECERISAIIDSLIDLRKQHFTLIRVFPFVRSRTKIQIECVRPNSYAEQQGLQVGDIINSINGEKVLINAQLYNSKLPFILNINDNKNILITESIWEDVLINEATEKLNLSKIINILEKDLNHSLVMMGEASAEMLIYLFKELNITPNYRIVKNEMFGGNLCGHGLLTIKDLLKNLKTYRKENPNKEITQIIIPHDIFKFKTTDVTGETIKTLQLEGQVKVILI